jgi:MoaA/NifB/PqqE/SkfB family radical SAM enzyme
MQAIRRLHVGRVMLTGGEPLLHGNLWRFCERLRGEGIRLTLATTGLLIERIAAEISRLIDEVVISVDGSARVHDEIRRTPGGFEKIGRGIAALRGQRSTPRLIARSVVQKANFLALPETITAIRDLAVDRLSFLAADVTSPAFNRPEPWTPERQQEITLSREELPAFAAAIDRVAESCADAFEFGFVQGGLKSLRRIHGYYAALVGVRAFPEVRCNAPWVSAVLEIDGRVRPCFFQPAYDGGAGSDLGDVINSDQAIAFRRGLDVQTNPTCRRCVCSLHLPLTARV